MMAERKRKQKWSLNPRGKNWSDNSNKFGQKLLEKMGWSAGKGLGANEDGMTEHIRVAYKNDTQGMGFKTNDDQWTEHESNFTELLNSLSANNSNEVESEAKLSSLEKKSQISKARVHYHKFTRGKDLSRYSEKDLANIFGKKSLKDLSKPQSAKEEKEDEKENTESKSFGVVTLNGGNMLDYFKNKLPNFKSNTNGSGSNAANNDSESDTERPSFGLGFGQNGTQNEEKQKMESEPVNSKSEKKKFNQVDKFNKRCFGLGYDRYNENESKPKSKFTSFVKSTDTDVKEPLKFEIKLKNANEKKDSSDNEATTIGFGFKTNSTKGKIQSSFMSFVKGSNQSNDLEAVDNTKIKRKRKNDYDNENIEEQETKKMKSESEASNVDDVGVNFGLGFRNKKKDKAKPTFVSFIKESETVQIEEDGISSPIKKKKNKKDKGKGNEDEILDDSRTEEKDDASNEMVDNSLRKKKKNKKGEENEGDNIGETENNSNVDEIQPTKKSKKRKSESEIDVAFTPIKKKFKNFEDLHTLQDEEKMVETPKKTKKNKVAKNNSDGVTNPAFDPLHNEVTVEKHHLDAIVEESESLVDTTVDAVTQENPVNTESSSHGTSEKKKKKKKSKGIDNPCLTEISTIDESLQSIDDSLSVSETQKKKKNKKSKKDKEQAMLGIENGAFNENCVSDGHTKEMDNKYEIKEKKKKRQGDEIEEILPLENMTNGEEKPKKKKNKVIEISPTTERSQSEQNLDTPKAKKKKQKELLSVENPCFNSDDSLVSLEASLNKYEVKRSKKTKNLGIVNPGLDLTSPPLSNGDKSGTVSEELPVVDDSSLMLNIVCTPIIKKEKNNKLQRRKSVRFSDVNQSIFINKTDSPADLRKNGGQDNAAYDQFGNRIEESLETLNKQLDDYQAEVENDLNEAKMQVMVGEVGDPDGENEILSNGEVKLKFKYANFGKMPPWMRKDNRMSPKSSYRHLIKGDIILGFKNTNMHDIKGYTEHLKASASP